MVHSLSNEMKSDLDFIVERNGVFRFLIRIYTLFGVCVFDYIITTKTTVKCVSPHEHTYRTRVAAEQDRIIETFFNATFLLANSIHFNAD